MIGSSKDFRSLSRYDISGSQYFDNNRQANFFDSYASAESSS
jgi:hypothetical protein